MEIKWLGHACFLLTGDHSRVITDPFNADVGYPVPAVTADVVTISHEHYDHNYVQAVSGHPQVVRGAGEHVIGSVRITGFNAFHDNVRGTQRGANTIFVIQMDGLRLCHLGDLGHPLTAAQVAKLGRVDVLLVPVGGKFTVDAQTAAQVVRNIKPAIVVPMHYGLPFVRLPLAPVEDFTHLFDQVEHRDVLTITAANLPTTTSVVVLAPPRRN